MLHRNSETRGDISLVSIHATFEIFQSAFMEQRQNWLQKETYSSPVDWKSVRSLRWLLFGYSVFGGTGKSRLENTQIPVLLSLPDGSNLHEEGFIWLSKSVCVLGQRLLAEVTCSDPRFPVDRMQRADAATQLTFPFALFCPRVPNLRDYISSWPTFKVSLSPQLILSETTTMNILSM